LAIGDRRGKRKGPRGRGDSGEQIAESVGLGAGGRDLEDWKSRKIMREKREMRERKTEARSQEPEFRS
jgi:hypothetical protein